MARVILAILLLSGCTKALCKLEGGWDAEVRTYQSLRVTYFADRHHIVGSPQVDVCFNGHSVPLWEIQR